MTDDRFFRADPVQQGEEWDGTPRIRMTEEQADDLLRLLPHYHACVLGPVPFGGDPNSRVRISIDHILAESVEKASEMIWLRVAQACDAYNYPLIPDEWDVLHLIAVNCC